MSAETIRAPHRSRHVALLIPLVAVAVLSSFAASLGALSGNKLLVVLPLALVLGGGLSVLALTRFSAFLVVLLIVRASLDAVRLSAASAGNTVTNSATTKGLDPSSLVGVLLLVTAAMWLAAQRRRGSSLPGSPLRTALLVFFAACTLSVLGSGNVQSSVLELLRIAAVVAMFVVLEQLMVDTRIRGMLLTAVFASAIFPLLFTVVGLATGSAHADVKGGFTRLAGTFAQANDFGRYLMIMVIAGVALLPYLSGKRKQLLIGLVAVSGVMMLLTLTITAVIGTVIGLVAVGVVQSKRLLGGLAVGLLAGFLLVPGLSSRLFSATDVSQVQSVGGSSNSSLSWRLAYWTEVLPLANSNPITGIGLNQTQYETDAAKQPHNDFLRAYVETGLIGLGAYLALLVSMVGVARRAVRTSYAGTLERGVGAGALGVACAVVFVSLASNVISNVALLWYVVAVMAAASAVVRTVRQQERALAPSL